jgi:uncharacterized protein
MRRHLSIVLVAQLCFAAVLAQTGKTEFQVKEIPQPLAWINDPLKWTYAHDSLRIVGGEKTDLFIDPQHEYEVVNSPKAVFLPADSFLLSARAYVHFKTDYDAGVLVVYAGRDQWAKLCFEYSPQKKPFVVSVVNNGISDDCNHTPIGGNQVYLRIAGLGSHVYAFHYSTDGQYWHLVRYFYLNTKKDVQVGFSSQSPTGKSCQTVFTKITYTVAKLQDIRGGK